MSATVYNIEQTPHDIAVNAMRVAGAVQRIRNDRKMPELAANQHMQIVCVYANTLIRRGVLS